MEAKWCRAGVCNRRQRGEFLKSHAGFVGGDDIQAATQLTGTRFIACSSTFQMMALLRGENRSFCLLAEFTDSLFLLSNHEKRSFGAMKHMKLSLSSVTNLPHLIKTKVLIMPALYKNSLLNFQVCLFDLKGDISQPLQLNSFFIRNVLNSI